MRNKETAVEIPKKIKLIQLRIPEEIHKQIKIRSIEEGTTITTLIVDTLEKAGIINRAVKMESKK